MNSDKFVKYFKHFPTKQAENKEEKFNSLTGLKSVHDYYSAFKFCDKEAAFNSLDKGLDNKYNHALDGEENKEVEDFLKKFENGKGDKNEIKTSIDTENSDYYLSLINNYNNCSNVKNKDIEKQQTFCTKRKLNESKEISGVEIQEKKLAERDAVLPNTSKFIFRSSIKSKVNNEHNKNIDAIYMKANYYENTKKDEQSATIKAANEFRTGREELIIQNIKKYGQPNNPNSNDNGEQPLFAYGQSKKSLGSRRFVLNKFVPPVKQKKMETSENEQLSEEPIDDRLKHIDPQMIERIKSEIMNIKVEVNWEQIAGLDYAKSIIREAVIWPLLRPDIFTGLRQPPRGILLFGPPGTGKTLIGKCIASQSKSTFFSISASSLTSKWIGDGEKMVRALFTVASVHQPAVIFIDEIDSLLSQRSEQEHESSRRIKTEFLVQLDGAATSGDERILIVGATNRPQELDEAARRRLVKRLYIPLPEFEARIQMLLNLLKTERHSLTSDDLKLIAKQTDGYSGADMKTLCQEASMGPIRSVPFDKIHLIDSIAIRPTDINDFNLALTRVRASVSQEDLLQYSKWDKLYGSGGC